MELKKIYEAINNLVEYGIANGLCEKADKVYITNLMYAELKLDGNTDEYVATFEKETDLYSILQVILDYAVSEGIIEDGIASKDLFDTKLMGFMVKRPSEVIKEFNELYEKSPKLATDYYYNMSKASDYIRTYRVCKDMKWVTSTEYGDLDITINLSKPEKDPKAIAAAKSMKQAGYPKCLLCKENEGFAGHLNHPARQNHRIIPVRINNSDWFMQYSPYVYYNEHCIVFNGEHSPMQINNETFSKLLDFVELFPHYFVGSNADLPIVGGSILTHDHFQGGCYEFPMAKAPVKTRIGFMGYEDVDAGIVDWPMSVIRLSGAKDRIIELARVILREWREYSDENAYIFAYTDGEMHNTITPIARMRNGKFELDLVLRNNITNEEHPDGVYHPHKELHHIKKENIGLIEVMGLAVLPARLKDEIAGLCDCFKNNKDINEVPELVKHSEWYKNILATRNVSNENIEEVLKEEIGKVFAKVLADAGVYKNEADFIKFIDAVNLTF